MGIKQVLLHEGPFWASRPRAWPWGQRVSRPGSGSGQVWGSDPEPPWLPGRPWEVWVWYFRAMHMVGAALTPSYVISLTTCWSGHWRIPEPQEFLAGLRSQPRAQRWSLLGAQLT